MKNSYIAECEVQDAFSREFRALVSSQLHVIEQMMNEGVIKSYSLSMDRAKLWIVFSAESDYEVLQEMSRMPLIDFIVPHISQLMFYNPSPNMDALQFSLN